MDSLIETFHIDITLIIAQAVNFAIVFFILYFLIIKPLLSTMNERSKKIEKSLNDADRIEAELKRAEEEAKKIIVSAKKEAGGIIELAAKQADEKKEEILARAKEEIGEVINKEKEKIRQEKDAALKEIRADVAGLVVAVAEKVLGEKVDAKVDQEYIKKVISK